MRKKKGWLTKGRRDKGPHVKVGNEVDCGQDSLAFDLVIHRNGQGTTQRLDLVTYHDLSVSPRLIRGCFASFKALLPGWCCVPYHLVILLTSHKTTKLTLTAPVVVVEVIIKRIIMQSVWSSLCWGVHRVTDSAKFQVRITLDEAPTP